MKALFVLLTLLFYAQNILSITFTSETYIEINPGNAPTKIVFSEESISQAFNGLYESTYPLSIGTTLVLIAFPIICDKTTHYIEKKTNLKNGNLYTMLTIGIAYAALGSYLFFNRKNLTSLLIKSQNK